MKKLVLIDGSNLAYRAFFALPKSLRTKEGDPTNALYGFGMMFRSLFLKAAPDKVAVVFDAPGDTFRDEKYEDYKATRPPMPDELRWQWPKIIELCELLGVTVLEIAGVEADDVIGTLAVQAEKEGHEVAIYSSDKDFAQLIGPRIQMVDTMRSTTFTREVTKEKWGIFPEQMIDYLALLGDAADNVPGVPGIGEKSARHIFEHFQSLEDLYEALENEDPRAEKLTTRQKNALIQYKDQALLSQDLVTIRTGIELPVTLEDLSVKAPPTGPLYEFYRKYQFFSLIPDEMSAEAPEKSATRDYRFLEQAKDIKAYFKSLQKGSSLAVFPVLELQAPLASPLLGVALSHEVGSAVYIPFKQEGSLFQEPESDLLSFLADPKFKKVFFDIKIFELALKRSLDKPELHGAILDLHLASFLVDPTKFSNHNPIQLAKDFLGRVLPSEVDVLGKGKKAFQFKDLGHGKLSDWACEYADVLFQLYPILDRKLQDSGLHGLHDDLEMPLARVLAGMEYRGILVDQEDLKVMDTEFSEELKSLESQIHEDAGQIFNVASPKQVAGILFENLGLPPSKKIKTGYSTSQEVLEKLEGQHPIIPKLLQHRMLSKLVSTYVQPLQRLVNPKTGRIHATFLQASAATGRLALSDPNLQATPARTKEGQRIRRAFIAPEGKQFLVADWSQIELRVLAHMSKDKELIHAFQEGLDIHKKTAGQIFSVPIDKVDKAQRDIGKVINFATIYGQGAFSLSGMLRIPMKDAKRYIDSYFELYSGVKDWLETCTELALERGWVETLLKRRRYIPELKSRSRQERQAGIRIACNTPIQGSAADLCKVVMEALPRLLDAQKLEAALLLQIHDEFLLEVPKGELEATKTVVKSAMEMPPEEVRLSVPLIADIGIGRSWSEAKT